MPAPDLLLILGNKNLSSWSLRPWVLLRHAGFAFEERVVPFESPGVAEDFSYASDTNTEWLTNGALMAMVEETVG